jgi:hypothetical protein
MRPYYRREALGRPGKPTRSRARRVPVRARQRAEAWEIAQDAKPGPKAIRADLCTKPARTRSRNWATESPRGWSGWPNAPTGQLAGDDIIAPQIEFVFRGRAQLFH